jgi:hypothetical protein
MLEGLGRGWVVASKKPSRLRICDDDLNYATHLLTRFVTAGSRQLSSLSSGRQSFASLLRNHIVGLRHRERTPLFGFSTAVYVLGPRLAVRFPPAQRNTLGTATVLVEHHPGCARMHGVVSEAPAHRVERAIQVVDANIIDPDRVLILSAIFRHDTIVPPSSDRKKVAARALGVFKARVCLGETLALS